MPAILIVMLLGVAPAGALPPGHEVIAAPAGVDSALRELRSEARRLAPLVETEAAGDLLRAVPRLPKAKPAIVHYRRGGYLAEAYTASEYAALSEAERADLRELPVDTQRFYYTFYGSPLASVRAFDLAARHGLDSFEGATVLDFGFGSIGQLRLLATCGARAVGTEVMPRLRAMYADPALQGPFPPFGPGSVEMHFGRWPAETELTDRVGSDLDLFISKNTIKRGYVRPPAEVDPRQRMDFGVPTDEFLRELRGALRIGGLAVFYNLGGKPAGPGEDYRPATDIACPWSKAELETAGFEVIAHDADDTAMARSFAYALGWHEQGMDVDNALFGSYTILRRPR